MKRITMFAVVAALLAAAVAAAQTPSEVPFPATHTDVFVFAATYKSTGDQTNTFKAGETVTFNAFAADVKTKKVLTPATTTFFYVKIAGQPNVKLSYAKVGSRMLWVGTWTVPANAPVGILDYKVLVKTKDKKYGSFVQPAVANAQLAVVA